MDMAKRLPAANSADDTIPDCLKYGGMPKLYRRNQALNVIRYSTISTRVLLACFWLLLVPKLLFGNPRPRNSVSFLFAKRSFAEVRAQTEFGNEERTRS